MHSRAFLLLQRDLENLRRFPMEGVNAKPCSDLDMFHWEAQLHGLPDTPWDGGVFHLSLQFSGQFNTVPPVINFMTIPFHPNIDPEDGRPNCHLLSTAGWNEAVSLSVLLISLQSLLSSPEPQYTVNHTAQHLLHTAPHTYYQMARDCVSASLRINAGLPPYEEQEVKACPTPLPSYQTPTLPPLQPHPVSFDDYLSLWRGIATSTSPNDTRRPPSVDCRPRGYNLDQKLKQHHLHQHGQGGKELTNSLLREQRMNKLKIAFAIKEEEEEEEVDEILQWTKGLDDNLISTTNTPN